jgi:CRISPR-associated protein Cas2
LIIVLVLVTYDVSTEDVLGAGRLRRVSKICSNYGIRVQKSVFECNITPAQWESLKSQLLDCINSKRDSLRFYFLGSNWKRRVEHHGLNTAFEHDEPFIV